MSFFNLAWCAKACQDPLIYSLSNAIYCANLAESIQLLAFVPPRCWCPSGYNWVVVLLSDSFPFEKRKPLK